MGARREALRALTWAAVGALAAARCLTTLVVALCGLVLHGHILVWAIIAPRVVFELFFVLVGGVACLLVLWLA